MARRVCQTIVGMIMAKETPKGQRKLKQAQQSAVVLLIGFVVAVYCKADASLFAAFVTGLGVQTGAFIWGNRAEHAGVANKPGQQMP